MKADGRQASFVEAMGALKDLSSIVLEAKKAQVEALNQAASRCRSTSGCAQQVYAAVGVVAVGFDVKKMAEEVPRPATSRRLQEPERGTRRRRARAQQGRWSRRTRSSSRNGRRSRSSACDAGRHLRSRRHDRRQHADPRRGVRDLRRAPRAAAADAGRPQAARREAQPGHLPGPVRAPARPTTSWRAFADEKESLYRELSTGRLDAAGGPRSRCSTASTRTPSRSPSPRRRRPRTSATRSPSWASTRRFPRIVRGDEVPRGKPWPDVFLAAAERLGVPPAACVAFEDAPIGIAAARGGRHDDRGRGQLLHARRVPGAAGRRRLGGRRLRRPSSTGRGRAGSRKPARCIATGSPVHSAASDAAGSPAPPARLRLHLRPAAFTQRGR